MLSPNLSLRSSIALIMEKPINSWQLFSIPFDT